MLKWIRADLMTGEVLGELPDSAFQTTTVTMDIYDENTVDIEIPTRLLVGDAAGYWNTAITDKEIIALIDDSLPWGEEILFAGFVNKTSRTASGGTITIQVTGLTEYLKARIVGSAWTQITDPSLIEKFEASTWEGIYQNMVRACFSTAGIPAGAPAPPQLLGTVPAASGTDRIVETKVIEAKTYHEVLDGIRQNLSGVGLEWRFKPKYFSSAKNKIVFDLKTGTENLPQINSGTILTLDTIDSKIFYRESEISSTEYFTKFLIQSKDGEGTSGADLTPTWPLTGGVKPLFEFYYNPGEELTEGELQTQINSYMEDAGKNSETRTLNLATDNYKLWVDRLGAMVQQETGEPLRITQITFTPGIKTVELMLQTKQRIYPALPSAKALLNKKKERAAKRKKKKIVSRGTLQGQKNLESSMLLGVGILGQPGMAQRKTKIGTLCLRAQQPKEACHGWRRGHISFTQSQVSS